MRRDSFAKAPRLRSVTSSRPMLHVWKEAQPVESGVRLRWKGRATVDFWESGRSQSKAVNSTVRDSELHSLRKQAREPAPVGARKRSCGLSQFARAVTPKVARHLLHARRQHRRLRLESPMRRMGRAATQSCA